MLTDLETGDINTFGTHLVDDIHVFNDIQLDGNLNGWGAWIPTWTGMGTGTLSLNQAYYKNFGDIYWFTVNAQVGTSWSGGSTIVTFTLPATPYRGTANQRQIFPVHFEAGSSDFRSGEAVCLAGGSGAVVDRIRIQGGGATDDLDNLTAAGMQAGRIFTCQGWFRST